MRNRFFYNNNQAQASFASGEVRYLLNQKVSDGTQVWYQNLSGQNADAYPVLKKNDNSTVYYGYEKCARIYTYQSGLYRRRCGKL